MTDTQLEAIVWANFYANIIAMEKHPGNRVRNDVKKEHRSFMQLAQDADIMLDEWRKRFTNKLVRDYVED